MATFDFTPLYRSTVGYDRLPLLLSQTLQREEGGYPPYNIEKFGEDRYRIEIAVAGFSKDDVEIVAEQNRLTVRGQQQDKPEKEYLHQGIASRTFEREFALADYVQVAGATMADGVLTIDLKRELPEELKPRVIEIGSGKVTQIEPKNLARTAA